MVQQIVTIPRILPSGEIVAVDMSEDDYMHQYAEQHHEWIEGVVIKMSPVTLKHDGIVGFLRELFRAYFALRPIGQVIGEPFVMRLPGVRSRREPDLQVILNSNPGTLHDTYMDGPADICIEVVSPGSVGIDYGDKFAEYEKGGVGEYWLADPIRQTCRFYRLTDAKLYKDYPPDADGYYTTPRLPRFRLHVPTLWQDPLPDIFQVVQPVQDMLQGSA